MKQADFDKGLDLLARNFNYRPSGKEKQELKKAFGWLDGDTWFALCTRAAITLHRFPGVGDLLRVMRDLTAGVPPEQRARELWALTVGLMSRYGTYSNNPLDGVARVVSEILGGWSRLCSEPERLQWPFINLATKLFREGLDNLPANRARKELYAGTESRVMLTGPKQVARLLPSAGSTDKPCPDCPECPTYSPPEPLVRLMNDLEDLAERMQKTRRLFGTEGLERFFTSLMPRLEREIKQARQALAEGQVQVARGES